MSFADVIDNTVFLNFEAVPGKEQQITDALQILYVSSPLNARPVLDRITASNPLIIEYIPDKFEALRGLNRITIDPEYLNDFKYYDNEGIHRSLSLEQGLIHELGHAILGLRDPQPVDLNTANAEFKGDVVNLENSVMEELGYGGERSGYFSPGSAYSFTPDHATYGNTVDFSYVDPISGGSSGLNRSGDNRNSLLVMVDDENDTVTGGNGRNFVYSGDGTDQLTGGAGADCLNGEAGNDTLIASTGLGADDLASDYMLGGAGNDSYTVDFSAHLLRDVQRNGVSGSINYNMFNHIDIIKDTDGVITYRSEYKQSGQSIGDYAITGTFSLLSFGSYTFGPGISGSANQVNGLNPVYMKQLTINGTYFWNLYAMPVSFINPINNVPTSGVVFFEEIPGLGSYRAICAIEGFTNGNFGITLTGYSGPSTPPPTGRGSDGEDNFNGQDGINDAFYGESGNDVIRGRGGADYLAGEEGDDEIEGGDDDDILVGGTGADILDGGNGTDTVSYANATSGDLYVHMGWVAQNQGDAEGDTYISIENIEGSFFDDTIIATDDANVIRGGNGNDSLLGLQGNDTIYGGNDWDEIYGNEGNDLLYGEDGDDIIFGYEDDDTLVMGKGNDYGIGGDGDDTLDGGEGDDELYGHDGNDVIDGGTGNDLLFGDAGNDRIIVGTGNDFALGGSGNDAFVFHAGLGGDIIGDFSGGAGASDTIELHDLGITSFAQLQTYMSEWNGTTYIEFDAENYITLEGVTMSSLSQDDFILI